MKHVFIVNPSAGAESSQKRIEQQTTPFRDKYDIEIYETKGPRDATGFVNDYCKAHKEPVRFYACGGDGTLNEVAQGVYENENASLGCFPCGSGNDFVKYYGGMQCFENVEELLNAKTEKIDLMRVNDRISVNVTNFGFDATVAKTMIKVKRRPLIGGKNAYTTGIVKALLCAMKTKCKVIADGKLLNESGNILLCTVANGKYVGGSFMCAPRSSNTDGLLEVCLVKPISRLRFPSLMGPYTKGEHLDDPRFDGIITYCRAKSIKLEAMPGFIISLDGEIVEGSEFTIDILEGAVEFAVPESCRVNGSNQPQMAVHS